MNLLVCRYARNMLIHAPSIWTNCIANTGKAI